MLDSFAVPRESSSSSSLLSSSSSFWVVEASGELVVLVLLGELVAELSVDVMPLGSSSIDVELLWLDVSLAVNAGHPMRSNPAHHTTLARTP